MHVTNLKVFIVLSPFLFFAHSYITPPINTIGINKITNQSLQYIKKRRVFDDLNASFRVAKMLPNMTPKLATNYAKSPLFALVKQK
jgi:hypothetical protein